MYQSQFFLWLFTSAGLLQDYEGLETRLNGHDWLADADSASSQLPTWSSAERDSTFERRGVYSFCMCPGGQIVPTATRPDELCINGMSFSRRNSKWANSALVASVLSTDLEGLKVRISILLLVYTWVIHPQNC